MSNQHECLRVLVVDDEIRVADSLAQILIASGHEAVPAYSAEAAIRMADKFSPHAVISDIVMGGPISGIELSNHIREHFPQCKVLLISGHATTREFTQKLMARGSALQFAPKPVPPDRILEFVASCMATQGHAERGPDA
jgi:DNA-binding NtrC family response regulator